jgi:transposase
MARKPYRYRIKLSPQERKQLQMLIRAGTTERRVADRARIILWAADGLTIAETQRRLACSEQTILNWRRIFLARRGTGNIADLLQDRPRPGRPPKRASSVSKRPRQDRLHTE